MTEKSAYRVLIAETEQPPVTLTAREGDLNAARGIANAMPYSTIAWTVVVLVFAGCYYLI